MLDEVLAALDYFKPKAVTRYPGAAEEQLSAAEAVVGCRFPPSMRAFLQLHDGALLPDLQVYCVAAGEPWQQIIGNTNYWRERTGENYVIIAGDQSGDAYALLIAEAGPEGEYPIAMLDHETGYPMGVVASTYERFLWFALDDMKRSFRKDGEYRAAEVYGPWPFSDEAWVLRHDPDLKGWRKLYEPPEKAPVVPELTVLAPEVEWPLSTAEGYRRPSPDEMVLLPDGGLVVATRGSDVVGGAIWDLTTRAERGLLNPVGVGLCALTVTSEGRIYAAGRSTHLGVSVSPSSPPDWNTLYMWDWEADRIVGAIEGQPSLCYRADWEPGGCRIAATYGDGTVVIFHLATQRVELTMRHPTNAVAVCFSADGSLLATGGRLTEKRNSRAEVSVWCTATGERLHRLELEPEGVSQLVFSPDSSTLAVSRNLPNDRGQIDLWDLRSGTVKQLADCGIHRLVFNPNGGLLLANYLDRMRLWEVETGVLKVEFGEATPSPYAQLVSCIAVLPGGKHIVAGRSNGVAQVWALPEEIAW
jgi:hypothetical protein